MSAITDALRQAEAQDQAAELVAMAVSQLLAARPTDGRARDGYLFGRFPIETTIRGQVQLFLDQVDVESSASRQHFVDTGRYLRKGEAL